MTTHRQAESMSINIKPPRPSASFASCSKDGINAERGGEQERGLLAAAPCRRIGPCKLQNSTLCLSQTHLTSSAALVYVIRFFAELVTAIWVSLLSCPSPLLCRWLAGFWIQSEIGYRYDSLQSRGVEWFWR